MMRKILSSRGATRVDPSGLDRRPVGQALTSSLAALASIASIGAPIPVPLAMFEKDFSGMRCESDNVVQMGTARPADPDYDLKARKLTTATGRDIPRNV